tara:strand:+ start:81 stop:521 length:441 start_codon:yes stop_codon:yes gene_type:complete
MEENSVLSNKQLPPLHESKLASLPKSHQIRVITRFWQRMAQIYGHRFHSAWGSCANDNGTITDTADLWLQGLSKYSMDEIKNGITKLIDKGLEWPPTLPEFMHLCKPERLAPYHQMATPQLPAPEIDPALVSGELHKIRKLLRRAA